MAWNYGQFAGSGGGTTSKPAQYSDQYYKNLQSSGQLGGSTLAERIISDELAGKRPGTSEDPAHVSGTFFGDSFGAGGAGAGGVGGVDEGAGGGGGSLGGLMQAASGNNEPPTKELSPLGLRQGIGERIYPQDAMALAGLKRAY